MSFLSGLTHVIGDVAAPVVKGVGAVLPGSEGDRLSSIGASIANPNVTYTGTINPLSITNTGGTSWATGSGTPNKSVANANNPTGTTSTATPSSTYTGGGSGSSTPDLSQYNYYTGLANQALNDLNTNYDAQRGAVNQQYGVKLNEYNSAKTTADQGLQQNLQQAKGQFVTNQNQINENARQEQQSLLRQLGILGAGGGSAALFAIPNAVHLQQNQALSGAGQNYAQNAQQANTAYNNYINSQYTPGIQELQDWKQNQLNQQQADYSKTHQGLLNVLNGLQTQSAPAADLASQVLSYQSQIPNVITPASNYTGQIAQYTAPSLNSYEQQVLPQAQLQGGTTNSSNNPMSYLGLLTGQQKKQSNQLV